MYYMRSKILHEEKKMLKSVVEARSLITENTFPFEDAKK
jgi:hypothetical protein